MSAIALAICVLVAAGSGVVTAATEGRHRSAYNIQLGAIAAAVAATLCAYAAGVWL